MGENRLIRYESVWEAAAGMRDSVGLPVINVRHPISA